MPILTEILTQAQAQAVAEADRRARGTVLDAEGNEVLAPPVAEVLDYANQLKIKLDEVLGSGVRRADDPEAVPVDFTGFFRWVVDVPFRLGQQLELAMAQQAATMQVLSDAMGGQFASLAPRIDKAQADATASLLSNQANALAIAANDRRDEAQAADIVAVKLQQAAAAQQQAAQQLDLSAQRAASALVASRVSVVEQEQATLKSQAAATAAGLVLVQAQQTKDEQAIAAAQAQADAAKTLAQQDATALATMQTRLTADEQALATLQAGLTDAKSAAAAADAKATAAAAKAESASNSATAAQATATTAVSSAADAKAAATAVGARFREVLGVAVPAISIGQTGQVTVSWSLAFADTGYGVHIQPETSGLLGLVGVPLSKTTTSCVLQLKSGLGLAVALGGTISVTLIHP